MPRRELWNADPGELCPEGHGCGDRRIQPRDDSGGIDYDPSKERLFTMAIRSKRRPQGGDVPGEEPIDISFALGRTVDVASASYDPGYTLERSLPDTTGADLKQGYCAYGRSIGERGTFDKERRGGRALSMGDGNEDPG